MSAIVKLVQGSPEWHQHRLHHRNASETPAVLGVSPWMTAYELWQVKTGRAPQPEVTVPMAHGTKLEPQAREAYEQLTGHVMEPLVLVDGEYSASLDGITLDRELIVEIKAPYKRRDSELWQSVTKGVIPEHYRLQLQHQLMVAGAANAHLYVFDGTEGILIEERPRMDDWIAIREEWEVFVQFITEDRPPPLVERDVVIRTDAEWIAAAQEYIETKQRADETAAALDSLKQRLTGLARHNSEQGGGVSVSRYWKAGSVDYRRVRELVGVDLEQYRGAEREETRVTILK